MLDGIEFTDRYGGRLPSGITVCRGHCEGMGCYPTRDPSEWPADALPLGTPEDDGTPDDGWRFVVCHACNGTGRISLRRGLLRLPRLWWKAAGFVWNSRTFGVPPGWHRGRWLLRRVEIAFLYDLYALHPRTARRAR